jgi:hypothetical protein
VVEHSVYTRAVGGSKPSRRTLSLAACFPIVHLQGTGCATTIERMATEDEERAVERVVDRLSARFTHLPKQRVSQEVQTAYHQFDSARIREFVPIMVEKQAKDRLARIG